MREISAGDAVQRLGARVAVLLREVFPDCRAKRVARAFNVSVPTAERWLAGQAPAVPHLARMAQFWPRRFVAVVFPPEEGGDGDQGTGAREDGGAGTWRHRLRAAKARLQAIVVTMPGGAERCTAQTAGSIIRS